MNTLTPFDPGSETPSAAWPPAAPPPSACRAPHTGQRASGFSCLSRRAAWVVFAFFLLKGLAWLVVPALIAYGATQASGAEFP